MASLRCAAEASTSYAPAARYSSLRRHNTVTRCTAPSHSSFRSIRDKKPGASTFLHAANLNDNRSSSSSLSYVARPQQQLAALARPDSQELDFGDGDEGGHELVQKTTNWDDYVDDWWSFWNDEQDAVGAFDMAEEVEDEHDATPDNKKRLQKARRMAHALLDRLPYLQDNPEFVGVLPVPSRDRTLDRVADPGPRDRPNPEWSEWALRAWMEKRRAKERANALWEAKRAEVGRFSYVHPSWRNDVRLMQKPEREWTHEEILDLITQGGRAADPANVPLLVEDPEMVADYVAQGVTYIPETEEYLQQIGHWMENVSQEELDKEVTLLASEFADFEDGGAIPSLLPQGDDGDGGSMLMGGEGPLYD